MSRFEDNLWGSVIDRHGEELARAGAPAATRTRRTRPRVLAGATGAVAASATAVTLLVGATATPPAFAVIRHRDGSVTVKINRPSSIAAVNRTLAAMGIEKIGTRATTTGDDLSSIPSCSAIPPGWKGEWVQISGEPMANDSGSSYVFSGNFAPGSWHLVFCAAVSPTEPNPSGTGTMGTSGAGTTGTTGSGATGSGTTGAAGSGATGSTGTSQ